MLGSDGFPRLFAQTLGFSAGVPQGFTISADGSRVAFLRSDDGFDSAMSLWVLDVDTRVERLIAAPRALDDMDSPIARAESMRRDLAHESGSGIAAFAADRDLRTALFALGGRLFAADMADASVRELPVSGPVFDPRPDPTGRWACYVQDGGVRVIGLRDGAERLAIEPEARFVTYGLAEVAAPTGRLRGYWWSPDGDALLISRVDASPVQRWLLTDPSAPDTPPIELAMPMTGNPNADVSLWVVRREGARRAVQWDRTAYEYVVACDWTAHGPIVAVQSRDQRTMRVLRVDPATGATKVLREETDSCWVHAFPGTPAETSSGALVWIARVGTTYSLCVGNEVATPPGMRVDAVLDVDADTVLFAASPAEATLERDLWTFSPARGLARVTDGAGVHDGRRAGNTTVVVSRELHTAAAIDVRLGNVTKARIESRAAQPPFDLRVTIHRTSEGGQAALFLPSWFRDGGPALPVLMDPYAGPGSRKVMLARTDSALVSQYFAEQGFAVVVADGRGTPGRPEWERAIFGDIAGPVLDDQVAALEAVAEAHPGVLDRSRVGIRGWSFGGYLAALAVLRRPDVFHAAIAGAAVSDQRMYQAYWKERFLGHPGLEGDTYRRCSLLPEAASLRRPLLLVHGLLDDNVLVSHTLRMSAAIFAAGRPHSVLLLPGVTHHPLRDGVADSLLLSELAFLRQMLGDGGTEREGGNEAARRAG